MAAALSQQNSTLEGQGPTTYPVAAEQEGGPLGEARHGRIHHLDARDPRVLLQRLLHAWLRVSNWTQGGLIKGKPAAKKRLTRSATTSGSSYLKAPFHPSSDKSPAKASSVRSPGLTEEVGPHAAAMLPYTSQSAALLSGTLL